MHASGNLNASALYPQAMRAIANGYGYPGSRSRNAGANPTPATIAASNALGPSGKTLSSYNVSDEAPQGTGIGTTLLVFGMAAVAIAVMSPKSFR